MLYDPRQHDSIRDHLLQAADLIEQGQWCRGRFHDNKDGHCTVGAIYRVITGKEVEGNINHLINGECLDAYRRLLKYLNMENIQDLYTWNDCDWYSKQTIVDSLRMAAYMKEETKNVV